MPTLSLRLVPAVLIWVLAAVTLCAQADMEAPTSRNEGAGLLLRHDFGQWLDPMTPSLKFGVDYQVRDRLWLRFELGTLLRLRPEDSALLRLRGWRSRQALRWYAVNPYQ
ncbi:MAG: hypothetical protein AAGJ82_11555, partial [Bacteroidota bacterium]